MGLNRPTIQCILVHLLPAAYIQDYPKWEILPIHKWVVLRIEFIMNWDMLVMKSEKRSNPRETTINV